MDRSTLEILALTGTGVGALGLLVALVGLIAVLRLRRTCAILQSGDDRESLIAATVRSGREVDALRRRVERLGAQAEALRDSVGDGVRHVSVVRYDAFPDMGGRMSFSAALLDDAGDGLVLSAINGRQETRAYAKAVQGGSSDLPLSPEEKQAIARCAPARGVRRPARQPASTGQRSA